MNNLFRRSMSVVFLGMLMQAPVNAEISDGIGHKMDQSSGNTAAMGANHPPVSGMNGMGNMGGMTGQMGKGTMPANMPKMPEGPKKQGKVLEQASGGGYSYLLIDVDGQQVWVAGTQVSAKVGDIVSYVENVTMSNFTSRTINRTFDKIVFASAVAVVN